MTPGTRTRHVGNTGMERIQVLTRLRSAEVLLPEDWEEVGSPQQSYLLTWLLDHEPLNRPTSAELAQSDWLPPLLVEESTMQTLVRTGLTPAATARCLRRPRSKFS